MPLANGDTLPAMFAAPTKAISPLDRIDPRARILAVLGLATAIVAVDDIVVLAAALAGALALSIAARVPWALLAPRLAAVDGFVLLAVATLPFTTSGEPVLTLPGLAASREGLLQALRIVLKANAVLLLATALLGALDARAFAVALRALGCPRHLVHILLFMDRYVAVLHEEYRRLRTAMRARAFRAGNSMHTWRSLGFLVGMLLVRALERAERVLQAMKCRGFDGAIPIAGRHPASAANAVFLVATACGALALLFLGRTG